MRKLLLAAAASACALSLSAAASAGVPTKTVTADTETFDFPVGTLCDFHYRQTFSEVVTKTVFDDGRVHTRFDSSVVHTNVDTGYTLTEEDHFSFLDITDVRYRNVGLAWHLRDPSGKLVLVHAGTVWFDSVFDIIKMTPNAGGDLPAVVCPALGGHPA